MFRVQRTGVMTEVFFRRIMPTGFRGRSQIQLGRECVRELEIGWEDCMEVLLWACISRLAGVNDMCKKIVAGTMRKADQGQMIKGLAYQAKEGRPRRNRLHSNKLATY